MGFDGDYWVLALVVEGCSGRLSEPLITLIALMVVMLTGLRGAGKRTGI